MTTTLDILIESEIKYNDGSFPNKWSATLYFTTADKAYRQQFVGPFAVSSGPYELGTDDNANNKFVDVMDMIDYYKTTKGNQIVTYANTIKTGEFTLGNFVYVEKAIADYVAAHSTSITPMAAISTTAVNAPTNAPTNYGLLAPILGSDANTTNGKQNSIGTAVNTLDTRLTTLIQGLRTQGIVTP